MSTAWAVVVVDFSAAARPVLGANSLWIAWRDQHGLERLNLPTRHDAGQWLRQRLLALPAQPEPPVLAGPRGLARWFAAVLADGPDNHNTRFEWAARLNRLLSGDAGLGPFWGRPAAAAHTGLPARKPVFPVSVGTGLRLPERRQVERRVPQAKSSWQLAYQGAVGSQQLLGLGWIGRWLLDLPGLTFWPFEAPSLGQPELQVVLAEVYPSRWSVTPEVGEVIDAAQVRSVAEVLWQQAREGGSDCLLAMPESTCIPPAWLAEEGWMLGEPMPCEPSFEPEPKE